MSIYVEDVFLKFSNIAGLLSGKIQDQDFQPIYSFAEKIIGGEELTQNQGNYVIKLLEKYKNILADHGYDYRNELITMTWRRPFRVLDLSKRIYVEKDAGGKPWVCAKFPYQMKKQFDDTILSSAAESSYWDHEQRVRKLDIYAYNLVQLYEFALENNFEIDDTFMMAVSEVEEIWQNADTVVPFCDIGSGGLELINAPEDAANYYRENKKGNLAYNLILAKSMGYLLKPTRPGTVEKMASVPENAFWIKDYSTFFGIYNQLKDRVCIILDRTTDTLSWLQNFVSEADKMLVSRDEIKVCFRDSKDNNSGLNQWIKLAGVGGSVESGKILIFESRPAKWLFKDSQDVKLLVTNNIYPPTNTMTREWFSSHPCVIYLGSTRPTEQRGQKIVEL